MICGWKKVRMLHLKSFSRGGKREGGFGGAHGWSGQLEKTDQQFLKLSGWWTIDLDLRTVLHLKPYFRTFNCALYISGCYGHEQLKCQFIDVASCVGMMSWGWVCVCVCVCVYVGGVIAQVLGFLTESLNPEETLSPPACTAVVCTAKWQ